MAGPNNGAKMSKDAAPAVKDTSYKCACGRVFDICPTSVWCHCDDDKSTLLAYLQLCIRDEDWHGVWDTAIMLEVLSAKGSQQATCSKENQK